MDKDLSAKPNGRMHGITHHVSHRTRYRLASHHRHDEMVNRVKNSLAKVPGVKNVEFNERTGSLLVHHDEVSGIIGVLSTCFDNIAIDLFEELAEEELAIVPNVSVAAGLLGRRFARVNQYLASRTNNFLDLKMLLPLILTGAGIYQLSKERGTLNQVPAWVLFYYAYDAYLKFNVLNSHPPTHNPGNGHKGM